MRNGRRSASMRPEHFSSGNPQKTKNAIDPLYPFNEAGAFQLRKSAILCRALNFPVESRFNEAGAFQLRKSPPPFKYFSHPYIASMRPEHFCSGNLNNSILFSITSYSFNEAGAFLLRKSSGTSRAESMKNRFNEAGAFLLRKSSCERHRAG